MSYAVDTYLSYASGLQRGHQEDAEEFLGFFLDTLHEELLSALRRSANKLGGLKLSAAEKRLNGISDADLAAAGLDEEAEEREVTRPVSPNDGGWMEVGQKGKTSFTRTVSVTSAALGYLYAAAHADTR